MFTRDGIWSAETRGLRRYERCIVSVEIRKWTLRVRPSRYNRVGEISRRGWRYRQLNLFMRRGFAWRFSAFQITVEPTEAEGVYNRIVGFRREAPAGMCRWLINYIYYHIISRYTGLQSPKSTPQSHHKKHISVIAELKPPAPLILHQFTVTQELIQPVHQL